MHGEGYCAIWLKHFFVYRESQLGVGGVIQKSLMSLGVSKKMSQIRKIAPGHQ